MTMTRSLTPRLRPTLLALALMCTAAATTLPVHATTAPSVAWQEASADDDISKAFAQAKTSKKPVLLYWGAKWCPPCNQLKATLFNRADFIELSQAFVPVHIDGDNPGAQKLGARFKVRGYPTLILFSPEGQEVTRLPGEADAPQVLKVLQLGLSGGRPVSAVLADARAGKKLSANEWRLLGFYGWDTDEQQLVPAADRAALLLQLSGVARGVDEETGTRLLLKALAAGDQARSGFKPDAATAKQVRQVLSQPALARTHVDVLANGATDIVTVLAPQSGAERQAWVTQFSQTLKRFEADTTLSRADRVQALIARVELARLDQPKTELRPKLNPELLADVKTAAARADKEITDGHERQAVITSAAYALGRAGLWAESDALLKAGLAKSHAPYYLMSMLGGNAKKLGRKDEALRWYEEAFTKSEGPATRLQWGSGYLSALVELAPQDSARIEKVASQLLTEAAKDKGAFYERSARSLQRASAQLVQWNADGRNDATLNRLRQQLDGVCSGLNGGEKSTCDNLLKKRG
ncbi:thioredoxin family protein [Roseateles sp. BYS180W]|uniref:Thioredoxin family protein n=1 Tax=Roseateles rivi TaxID=3299028 RepID=A0ABW7FTW1_9BURK